MLGGSRKFQAGQPNWPLKQLCCYFKGCVEGKQLNKSKTMVSEKEGQGGLEQLFAPSGIQPGVQGWAVTRTPF